MRLMVKRRAILLALYTAELGLTIEEVSRRVHVLEGGYSYHMTYQSLTRLLKLGLVSTRRVDDIMQ